MNIVLIDKDIVVDNELFGTFKRDDDQNAWVLWPVSIDDGVTYFDDLHESFLLAKSEIENSDY